MPSSVASRAVIAAIGSCAGPAVLAGVGRGGVAGGFLQVAAGAGGDEPVGAREGEVSRLDRYPASASISSIPGAGLSGSGPAVAGAGLVAR